MIYVVFITFLVALALVAGIFMVGAAIVEELHRIGTFAYGICDALDNKDRMKLQDDVVNNLRVLAARPQTDVPQDQIEPYKVGLDDGATELAKYILSELKEEK